MLASAPAVIASVAAVATAISPAQAAEPVTTTQARANESTALAASVQTFKNLQTARCLENPAGFGDMVQAYPCNSANDQRWTVYQIGSFRELRNYATGRCLDHSQEYGVRAIRCNGWNWQRWLPHRASDGTIFLVNKATALCLGDGKQVFAHSCGDLTRRDLRWY